MSKFGDALSDLGVHNNHAMLRRFGQGNDAAVEYFAPPAGRLGWGSSQHTAVWHPGKSHPVIPLDTKWPHGRFVKRFHGPRRESWPVAMKWVAENIGGEFAPSPFGGRLPKTLIDRAKDAVKRKALSDLPNKESAS